MKLQRTIKEKSAYGKNTVKVRRQRVEKLEVVLRAICLVGEENMREESLSLKGLQKIEDKINEIIEVVNSLQGQE